MQDKTTVIVDWNKFYKLFTMPSHLHPDNLKYLNKVKNDFRREFEIRGKITLENYYQPGYVTDDLLERIQKAHSTKDNLPFYNVLSIAHRATLATLADDLLKTMAVILMAQDETFFKGSSLQSYIYKEGALQPADPISVLRTKPFRGNGHNVFIATICNSDPSRITIIAGKALSYFSNNVYHCGEDEATLEENSLVVFCEYNPDLMLFVLPIFGKKKEVLT